MHDVEGDLGPRLCSRARFAAFAGAASQMCKAAVACEGSGGQESILSEGLDFDKCWPFAADFPQHTARVTAQSLCQLSSDLNTNAEVFVSTQARVLPVMPQRGVRVRRVQRMFEASEDASSV